MLRSENNWSIFICLSIVPTMPRRNSGQLSRQDPKNTQAGLDLIRFLYTVKGAAAAQQELVARINAGGEIFPYQLALAEFDFDQGKADDSFKLLQTLINQRSATQV